MQTLNAKSGLKPFWVVTPRSLPAKPMKRLGLVFAAGTRMTPGVNEILQERRCGHVKMRSRFRLKKYGGGQYA